MENIVIVGSGGFAREVKWLIEECNKEKNKWNILGWISKEEPGTIVDGLPVLGNDEWVVKRNEKTNVVISVGDGHLRKKIAEYYRTNPNIFFPNIIAPNASMSDSVKMGIGCIVTAQSIFTVNITIGNFMICNLASTIGHDCVVDDYVTLYPGAHISGCVSLGECSSVGTGANIIQGLNIGRDSFIGAGAAVVRDIPNACTAVGVPAKPLEKKV